MAENEAIKVTVSGIDEHVGFRALVMKQAIEYNLAGLAQNDANQIVHFTLQGGKHRIDKAMDRIDEGTDKSSDLEFKTVPAAVDVNLKTFTIVDWTSTSRNITNPYTLVFDLRDPDTQISKDDAHASWRRILEKTLKGDDLNKLRPDD